MPDPTTTDLGIAILIVDCYVSLLGGILSSLDKIKKIFFARIPLDDQIATVGQLKHFAHKSDLEAIECELKEFRAYVHTEVHAIRGEVFKLTNQVSILIALLRERFKVPWTLEEGTGSTPGDVKIVP